MNIRAAVGVILAMGAAANSRAVCPANPLEMHAAFFDVNGDGKVEPWETVKSAEKLGMSHAEALAFAGVLHGAARLKLGGFDITIAGIAKSARHQGDTGIFNEEGQFDQAAFQRFFDRFDIDRSGALNEKEIKAAMKADKEERGSDGAGAAAFELPILVKLAGDRMDVVDGAPVKAISRQRLQEFYQGTLLYEMAGEPVPACAGRFGSPPAH